MMWIVIIAAISAIIWVIACIIDRHYRRKFIPMEEIFEKTVRSKSYIPWSSRRRLKYYNRMKYKYDYPMNSRIVHRQSIETGNTSDYRKFQ